MSLPAYWFTPPDRPGLRARLLTPWALWRARRAGADQVGWRAPVPVISVDMLAAGSVGNLPAVLAVIGQVQRLGFAPVVLARGAVGPVRIDPRRHCAEEVGGAALLAADFAPTWVAPDWAEGARVALAEGSADCLVMMGGLRDPALIKDLSIGVVDAVRGFGNGRCRPAGPLAEPLEAGLARVHLMLTVGPHAAQARFAALWRARISSPVMAGELQPLETGMDWAGARVLAFAGGEDPALFFAMLRGLGAEPVRFEALATKEAYGPGLLARLEREASLRRAQMVTTEEDAVRLPLAFRRKVLSLPMRLQVPDLAPLDAALTQAGLRQDK
ncbi:tetraacyldisaccharide 4'-kinase [Roseovarius mucosus]|uniref:tetraacyldisaccharide 4'-kinase n=1 Tax=Roseovarius mucosus TaxID=215743 RepID=UPI0035D0EDC4